MIKSISFRFVILTLFILIALSIFIAPLIGSTNIELNKIFEPGVFRQIIFDLRLPRVIFSFLVGFALAMVGAVFQAILRNELATPYTLGVSSGGALGAVLAIKSGIVISFAGFSAISVFSVSGSLITIYLIYIIARSKTGMSPVALILTGVTVSLFLSSLILFIHYLADFTETYRMIRWLMGGLQITGWQYTVLVLPIILIAFIYFFLKAEALNIISAGQEIAMSKGVDFFRLQKWSFFIASLLVGFIVAFAGPIGFVGLIIPHLMRLLIGSDHKKLIPSAALFGGVFLLWCDTLARIIIAPAELPVGVITAMLGGPFFIWLLLRFKQHV